MDANTGDNLVQFAILLVTGGIFNFVYVYIVRLQQALCCEVASDAFIFKNKYTAYIFVFFASLGLSSLKLNLQVNVIVITIQIVVISYLD